MHWHLSAWTNWAQWGLGMAADTPVAAAAVCTADPRLTDYDLLLQNLADLRAGRTTQVPIYDFKTSSRIGYNEVAVPSSRVIILEGIYALSERLRPMLDLRVSVNGGVHFDLIKRVLRDISRSGQGPDEIIQQVRFGCVRRQARPVNKTAYETSCMNLLCRSNANA